MNNRHQTPLLILGAHLSISQEKGRVPNKKDGQNGDTINLGPLQRLKDHGAA